MVFLIVAAQATIFFFDVATLWDDVAIGFLYIVPTLMSFFLSGNRLRWVVVMLSVLFIIFGGIFPLEVDLPWPIGESTRFLLPFELMLSFPIDLPVTIRDEFFVFLTGRIWALVTVLVTAIVVFYRIRLEQTLSAALDKERRASSLQRAFVSMVSHEFRTPLTIIDGEAYRMLKTRDAITPETLEKRARSIRSSVTRLIKLIEKILYTSRAFDNRIEMKVGRVNLWTLLRTISAQHAQVAPLHTITLHVQDIPVSLRGDSDLLAYVFDNLIGNAVKYSPSNSEVLVTGSSEPGHAVITVTDRGIGIPEDDRRNLFEPYYRGSNVGGVSGSGVGLYLVASFVRMHGGRIEVASTVGKGSTFTVSLPVGGPE